jgi:hypothetical protein
MGASIQERLITDEHRSRLKKEYMVMTLNELKYEYYQPDCPACRRFAKRHMCQLPEYCPDCGVIRTKDSPLVEELTRRGWIE